MEMTMNVREAAHGHNAVRFAEFTRRLARFIKATLDAVKAQPFVMDNSMHARMCLSPV